MKRVLAPLAIAACTLLPSAGARVSHRTARRARQHMW